MGAMARSSTEQAQAAALARAEAEVAALTQRLAAAEARTADTTVRQRLDQVGSDTCEGVDQHQPPRVARLD